MAQVTIATGFDVDYYLDQVGADYYLNAAGEPPGVWSGSAAPGLGLVGQVDPDTMRALYHHDIAPDGTPLMTSQRGPRYAAKRAYQQVQEAIEKRIRDELGELAPHMPDRVRKIRLEERAKSRTRTPYYDMTFSAEKSVSLAFAGLMAAAKTAKAEGREQDAERLEARARSVEAAVMAGADMMLGHVERRGAIIRTGHHSAHSGEFRDAAGFVAAKFLQHTSRSGDPQLHVQAPILNRAQRADGADGQWRALDGRPLWAERLGAAAYAGLKEAEELARLGFPLVKRADGNGFEIGGIEQKTMDAFSARSAAIAAKLAERLAEYTEMFGHPPNRQALFKLRKRVTVETRAAKHKPRGVEIGRDPPVTARQHVIGRNLGGRVQGLQVPGEDPHDVEPPGLVDLVAAAPSGPGRPFQRQVRGHAVSAVLLAEGDEAHQVPALRRQLEAERTAHLQVLSCPGPQRAHFPAPGHGRASGRSASWSTLA